MAEEPKTPATFDVTRYISKLSMDVENGLISVDDANRIRVMAQNLAPKGDLGAGDRKSLRQAMGIAKQNMAKTKPPDTGGGDTGGGTGDSGTTGGTTEGDGDDSTTTTPSGPSPETLAARQSAYETLTTWFAYYGIDNLAPGKDSLSTLIFNWTQADKSMDWIKLQLRQTDQYRARFPGMEELAKKGMAISEAEYISNERAFTQVLKASGMPTSFYDDRQDFANFMVAEISPAELASRVQIAKDYVNLYAPDTVKNQLRELYGMTDEQMAAYVLDTSQNKMRSLAALEAEYTKKMSQANVGGAAATAGMNVSGSMRDDIAEMGFDYRQSLAGFTNVQNQEDAYRRLGSLYGQRTSSDELVRETFGLSGGAEVTTKKRKLASKERAKFGGTSALSQSSLAGDRMGQV